MSWNLQQPITSELAAAKANKDGTDFTNPATWRTGLDVVNTTESRRQGSRVMEAVAFDGATSGTRITSNLTGQNIGTGDFSIWARFRVPSSIGATGCSVIGMSSSATINGGNNSTRISLLTAGDMTIAFQDGTGALTTGVISGFVSAYSGQIVDVVVTRTGSVLKCYVNGIDTAFTGSPAASTSITSTYFHVGIGSANTAIFPGRIFRSVVFNRALSATDVTELITVGVNPADQWGTQTQIVNTTTLNGGFETAGGGGADVFANWSEFTSGTGTIIRDTTDFSPNLGSTASARLSGTDGAAVCAINATSTSLQANKRYRLSAAHKRSNAGIVRWLGSTSNTLLTTFSVTTSWADYSAEFVIASSETFKTDLSGVNTAWTDNVIVERIGAIVDLDLSVGIGLFFPDRSDNRLGGDGFGGISHSMPREYGQITVVKELIHSDISSSLGTTLLFQLPPNCGIAHVEFDRVTAMDAGVTLEVGTAATGTKFAAATAASATGIIGATSASSTSESNSANTLIYIRKSGATTVGRVRVRVTYSIRG